jgi:phosphoribosyl-AMP cyclohydrolase
VKEIRLDCDGDTILLIVEQKDGIACHTGEHSCFFQQWDSSKAAWVDESSKSK